jgi:hypothetical protein
MGNTAVTVICALLLAAAAPSRAAGKVAAWLRDISGTRTVGGVHNDMKSGGPAYYTGRIQALTGKTPGLWSSDFTYDGRINNRWDMIYEAERQWKAHALVNLMWHACPPTVGEPCSWDGDIHSHLNDAQWKDLITDGGNLNKVWKQRMDRIAPYLKYLEDRGVEVLWRPHHEMNQGNFWWGGRTGPNGTAGLWKVTHDYFTKVKGFKNLIWVWDIQDLRFDWEGYQVGEDYFDVLALDMYQMGYTDSLYNSLVRLSGGKPIALGEVQKMPTPAVLEKYPLYTFVMGWAYMTVQDNSQAALSALFNDGRTLTRDEMPDWNTWQPSVGVAPIAARRGDRGVTLAPERTGGRMAIRLGPADAVTVTGRRMVLP